MGCFVPPLEGGQEQFISDLSMRLPAAPASADVRSSGDVIAF